LEQIEVDVEPNPMNSEIEMSVVDAPTSENEPIPSYQNTTSDRTITEDQTTAQTHQQQNEPEEHLSAGPGSGEGNEPTHFEDAIFGATDSNMWFSPECKLAFDMATSEEYPRKESLN
jgi:hypothetical protein